MDLAQRPGEKVTMHLQPHNSQEHPATCYLPLRTDSRSKTGMLLPFPSKGSSDHFKSKPKAAAASHHDFTLQADSQRGFHCSVRLQKLIDMPLPSHSCCTTNSLIRFLKFSLFLQVGVHVFEHSAFWNPFIPTGREKS